jgi:hypothetical protein
MAGTMAENVRLRLAYLNATVEEAAKASGEKPGNVRAWLSRGNLRGDTLERLAKLLGVPAHELLNPKFDPRAHGRPAGL